MESQESISQETEAAVTEQLAAEEAPQAVENVEAQAEAPAQPEEAKPAEAVPADATSAEDAPADQAAEEAQPAADVVATEDVSHARSRMDLARLAKESLIERARALADSTDWRETSKLQRDLMTEWNKAGFAGKDINDKLWQEFSEVRSAFFNHREEEVLKIKREIIQAAKDVTANVSNWKGADTKLSELMERWKAAGNSGSDQDQSLWDEFNGIRRDFRNRRKADFEKRRATTKANAQAKREIVDEAKRIAEAKEYTRENSDRMRQLDKDYKAIGFAGKPANDTLWAEFREATGSYWNGNSEHLSKRRQQRSEHLKEVIERKEGQIENLKSQNETLTTRLGSTLDPKKIEQIKLWISQNEERVDDLQDDIGDITKKM